MTISRKQYQLRITIFVLVYVAIAYVCLRVSTVSGYVALVWPPAGMSIAFLLINGIRFWPVITVASILASALSGSFLINIAGALAPTLEAVLAVYLLQRFARFDTTLSRVRDALSLIFYAAILSAFVGAVLGVTGEYLAGGFVTSAYLSSFVGWWVADALGILVVVPFMLQWRRWPAHFLNAKQIVEISSALTILAVVSIAVFSDVAHLHLSPFVIEYVIYPILIWIVLRYGQRGSVTAILLVSFLAVWAPLASPHIQLSTPLRTSLLNDEIFMAVSATTFMIMAASVAESKASQERQLGLVKRAARLSQQRARLVELNEAKDEFISIASHQLRTPATIVKQYLAMLQLGYAGKLTKAQLEMVDAAYEGNEQQLRSTNDLLNVAQIEKGTVFLTREKCDIKRLLDDVMQGLMADLESRQQKYECLYKKNAKYVVVADKAKLGMVLDNLISNASKYSYPGGLITVKLSKTPWTVTIAVTDEGVGMSKADIGKLFKKFNRLENPLSVHVGGMGLGLYWAKKIIDLHDGTISVTSNPKEGSTFEVTLPVETKSTPK